MCKKTAHTNVWAVFLVVKNIGINGIGPVGLVSELFQQICILADGFHAGNKHIPAVNNGIVIVGTTY